MAGSGDVVMTDGPFAEGKEHMGGFTVISVPDLDAALEWGRRIAEIAEAVVTAHQLLGGK